MTKPATPPRATAVDAFDTTVKALGEIYRRIIAATTKGKTPDEVADAQRLTLDGMLSGAGVFYQARRAGDDTVLPATRPKKRRLMMSAESPPRSWARSTAGSSLPRPRARLQTR